MQNDIKPKKLKEINRKLDKHISVLEERIIKNRRVKSSIFSFVSSLLHASFSVLRK